MTTRDEILHHCLAKPGAWQDMPWEQDLVVKVGGKIFVFVGSGEAVGVKCGRDRQVADEWVLRYPEDARALAYIGRYGWNSLRVNGRIPDDELFEAIDASYEDVVARLPKKERPAG